MQKHISVIGASEKRGEKRGAMGNAKYNMDTLFKRERVII